MAKSRKTQILEGTIGRAINSGMPCPVLTELGNLAKHNWATSSNIAKKQKLEGNGDRRTCSPETQSQIG